jgi:hypothetical protein
MSKYDAALRSHSASPIKPLQRQLELVKPANSRFGLDLCRVNGRVYILKVHEPHKAAPSGIAPVSYAAYRVGLRRFDEITHIDDEPVRTISLEQIYRYLHTSAFVNMTVSERAVVSAHAIPTSTSDIDDITDSCMTDVDGKDRCSVAQVISETPAAAILPANSSIVEINGMLTIGMRPSEIVAILRYARHKSSTGFVDVCTVPSELARGLLMAYVLTSDVYRKDWRPTEHLRKSIRFSNRGKVRLASIAVAMSDGKALGARVSIGSAASYASDKPSGSRVLRSLFTLLRL